MSTSAQPPARPLREIQGQLDAIALLLTVATTQVAHLTYPSLADVARPSERVSDDQPEKPEQQL